MSRDISLLSAETPKTYGSYSIFEVEMLNLGHTLVEKVVAGIIVVGVLIAGADTILEYTYPHVWRYDFISTTATYAVMIAVMVWALLVYARHMNKRDHMSTHGTQ
jgi:uncharacterized membrane protein